MTAAVSEAHQLLEEEAEVAASAMVDELVTQLNGALEAFFATMPLLHHHLSGTFTADHPTVALPKPTTDDGSVSGLAILGGGMLGGTLAGGSGIAVLVGIGLTPFGAALVGAIGAAAAAGWAVHLIRGGNRGKAQRELAEIRRAIVRVHSGARRVEQFRPRLAQRPVRARGQPVGHTGTESRRWTNWSAIRPGHA